MKTKNLFSRFSATALIAAAALIPGVLSSCSSDAEPNIPDEKPIPEGMAQIDFAISTPELGSATRADKNAPVSSDEGTINSLWVYFFKVGENNATELKYAFDIPTTSSGAGYQYGTDASAATLTAMGTVTKTDATVISKLNIEQGEYKIYVLANQAGRNDNLKPTAQQCASLTEAAVSGATFTETTGVIAQKNLPMAANCTELEVSDNVDYSDGIVNINKSGTVTVKAPMTILCSKVRFTFFFDNTADTGFSYPYSSFALNGDSKVKNINKVTSLFGTVADTSQEKNSDGVNLSLTRKDYPGEDALKNWLSTTYKDYIADLSDGGSGTNQYAYQGYVYITENLAKTKATKSTILFNTKLGLAGTSVTENKPFTIYLPNTTEDSDEEADVLKRGNFYDVVAQITGSGFKVYVKVNNWIDADKDSFEF